MINIPFKCRISPATTYAIVQVQKLLPNHEFDVGDADCCGYVYGVTYDEFNLVNELLNPERIFMLME